MDPLLAALKRVRRRLRLVRAVEAGLLAGILGTAAAGVLVLLRIFILRPGVLLADAPALPLLLVPGGFAAGFLARVLAGVSLRGAAVAADRTAGLKERLATALEVLEQTDRPAGVLDGRLLAQAREAAAALDVARLPMARHLVSRGRVLLAATLGLLVGAFIPSVAGPPLAPRAASRAAETIGAAARGAPIAPALRGEIERALAHLRSPGATRADADRATAALWRAAADADRQRREGARILGGIEQPDVRQMARAAASGDGAGAAAAADALADKLGTEPGSGGMPLADRERLADTLDGARVEADKADLTALAEGLRGAAAAVGRPDAAGAKDALRGLAGAMTAALGDEAAGGVRVLVAAAQGVRRDLGLADLPDADRAGPATADLSGEPGAALAHPDLVGVPGDASPGGPTPSVPPDVRPEDRPVVRRYFGG